MRNFVFLNTINIQCLHFLTVCVFMLNSYKSEAAVPLVGIRPHSDVRKAGEMINNDPSNKLPSLPPVFPPFCPSSSLLVSILPSLLPPSLPPQAAVDTERRRRRRTGEGRKRGQKRNKATERRTPAEPKMRLTRRTFSRR